MEAQKQWLGWMLVTLQLVCTADLGNCQDQGPPHEQWYEAARIALQRRLPRESFPRGSPARNVLLFVGDGMGLSTVTASRILKGQRAGHAGEDATLAWDTFPALALAKTYNADAQVGESSACATALVCGVKGNYETLGMDSSVRFGQCAGSQLGAVSSLLSWAHQAGKQTGIVTNTRITHATPAALYAHAASRFWEDDSKLPGIARPTCKDIARQLLEDEPGASIKVILGGGRRHLTSVVTQDPEPPHREGRRLDGRNLIEDWLRAKRRNGFNASYVTTAGQLADIDTKKTDFLLGLFASSHMDFEAERDGGPNGDPSLTEMTLKALQMLTNSENGYFLMVEGGRIDHAHHFNNAYRALDETLALEKAVTAALAVVDLNSTLLLITADHSHVLVFGGYATPRGNSIFGYDKKASDLQNKPYTTLLYSNGPGGASPSPETRSARNASPHKKPLQKDSTEKDTIQRAAVARDWATHAGEDVPVYAIGPMATDLFGGTIDQTYIPHAIAYAACMGHFQDNCREEDPPPRAQLQKSSAIKKQVVKANKTHPVTDMFKVRHLIQLAEKTLIHNEGNILNHTYNSIIAAIFLIFILRHLYF